jgi:hypothetical protein
MTFTLLTLLVLGQVTDRSRAEEAVAHAGRRLLALRHFQLATRSQRQTTDAEEQAFTDRVAAEREKVDALLKHLHRRKGNLHDQAELGYRAHARTLLLEEGLLAPRAELKLMNLAGAGFTLKVDGEQVYPALEGDDFTSADRLLFDGLLTPGAHALEVRAECSDNPVPLQVTVLVDAKAVLDLARVGKCGFKLQR